MTFAIRFDPLPRKGILHVSTIAEKLADQLAIEVIKHIEKTGDEDIVGILSRTMEDSSQTLQEAFVTSVRVQRAALRARRQLAERARELAARSDG